jgi:uncharacterized protein
MAAKYLTQDQIEACAVELVSNASRSIDIVSPWVEGYPIQRLLSEALARIRSGELSVRLVYRLSDPKDLEITDLRALEALKDSGVEIRYSRRLHAKLLVADRSGALVGSSNLTGRGGYGYHTRPELRNQEGGVFLDEPDAVWQTSQHFEEIWQSADSIHEDLVGVVMDFPSVREFRFICVKDVAAGQFVQARSDSGSSVVGEVVELTAYNQSFPQMTEEMFLTQGYETSAPRRVNVPDLPSLFSHPVKDRGYLVAKTFFHPESAFHIARVNVLREFSEGPPRSASAPIAPGSDVSQPDQHVLRSLFGEGDLRLGRMLRHPEVGVSVDAGEIITKHLAVLGMTGSGKSNAAKHLLRALSSAGSFRTIVVDTHGEYGACAAEIDSGAKAVDVWIPDQIDLLDDEIVKEHFQLDRISPSLNEAQRRALRQSQTPEQFAATLSEERSAELKAIAEEVAANPEAFCIGAPPPRVVGFGTQTDADISSLGTYILDLRETTDFEIRARKCAAIASKLYEEARRTRGQTPPTLLVVDEAHNFAPERTTGLMAKAIAHGSLGAITTLAAEGRKFNIGLVVISQRPSRLSKDVLAQMNSQLVFRLSNADDLKYVRDSFEAASQTFLDDLPNLDTGVCSCSGTMIATPVQCDVPLFAPRHSRDLDPGALTADREALRKAVTSTLPQATELSDADEMVVFAGEDVEVTIRATNGSCRLDIDCADGALADMLSSAVASAVSDAKTQESP